MPNELKMRPLNEWPHPHYEVMTWDHSWCPMQRLWTGRWWPDCDRLIWKGPATPRCGSFTGSLIKLCLQCYTTVTDTKNSTVWSQCVSANMQSFLHVPESQTQAVAGSGCHPQLSCFLPGRGGGKEKRICHHQCNRCQNKTQFHSSSSLSPSIPSCLL